MTINVGDLVVPCGRACDFTSARAYGWPCKVAHIYHKRDGTEMIQFLSNPTHSNDGGLVLRDWASYNLRVYVEATPDPYVDVVCDLIVSKWNQATCKAACGHLVYHFHDGQWVRLPHYTRYMIETCATRYPSRQSYRGKVTIKVRTSNL